MLIRAITQQAPQRLILEIENQQQRTIARSIVLCRFSALTHSVDKKIILMLLKPLIQDYFGAVFFCDDGDLFVQWQGAQKDTVKAVEGAMLGYVKHQRLGDVPDGFFTYHDFNANRDALLEICKKKIAAQPKEPEAAKEALPKAGAAKKVTATVSSTQKAFFEKTKQGRVLREVPEILIVEDQVFSQKLMLNVLRKNNKCVVASTAEQAILEFVRHAPDIVFLDIELPDLNGHEIGGLFRQLDPDLFIVMVTANNYSADVQKAKANQVQGFIVKPYSKEKLLDAVAQYRKSKTL